MIPNPINSKRLQLNYAPRACIFTRDQQKPGLRPIACDSMVTASPALVRGFCVLILAPCSGLIIGG